jgi:hypothetical protein
MIKISRRLLDPCLTLTSVLPAFKFTSQTMGRACFFRGAVGQRELELISTADEDNPAVGGSSESMMLHTEPEIHKNNAQTAKTNRGKMDF